jgi:hypothetical protein
MSCSLLNLSNYEGSFYINDSFAGFHQFFARKIHASTLNQHLSPYPKVYAEPPSKNEHACWNALEYSPGICEPLQIDDFPSGERAFKPSQGQRRCAIPPRPHVLLLADGVGMEGTISYGQAPPRWWQPPAPLRKGCVEAGRTWGPSNLSPTSLSSYSTA